MYFWLHAGVEDTGHVTIKHCFTKLLFFIVFFYLVSFCSLLFYVNCVFYTKQEIFFLLAMGPKRTLEDEVLFQHKIKLYRKAQIVAFQQNGLM